ncbi:granzyme H-like [Pelodiscus sinensis]|uniref:granzyme H-like n=1 Tax=Pelodiscus sinensis TaxID=13735 RepID=UPI003F6B15AE
MAYLYIRGANEKICGGFLVAEDFVLTAAHCQGEEVTVYLGAHNVHQPEDTRQEITVQLQTPHENYNKANLHNDIMLLQLKSNAELNSWVEIVKLPNVKEKVKPYTVCSIAGWGFTSTESSLYPDTLQEVEVQVMPDAACPRKPVWLYGHYNPKTMMCVGNPSYCRDSAQGDSGGPLVCDDTAQGIVSWGPCKAPGVHTKISAFLPWINDTMRRLRDRPRL